MDLLDKIIMQIEQLNMWTKAYDEGNPIVSDKKWDEEYFKLVDLENKSGIYLENSPTQNIQYNVETKLMKVTHDHPMLSLAKTKDWNEFLNYFDIHDVIGMPKMDGLTGSLRYVDGRLISAQTRGNGLVGEDITHNAITLKSIPKRINYLDELIIDGEFICTAEDFKPFADEYANQRNFAAGSIRLLDSKECAKRNLTFVVWNIIKGFDDNNSFYKKLNEVEKLGFTIVPYTTSFDWDAKEFLQDQAKELGYPIDGLVGRFDDIAYGKSLGETSHHLNDAFAFKFYDEEYETELIDIEWSMGRTGQITPVAIFKPIEIENTIVERASLHNLSILEETLGKPYIGQKLKVAKMNMIIPQIVWAEKEDE